MYKKLAVGIIIGLTMASGCKGNKNSPQPRPSKPLINAQVVALCIDSAFKTREADEECAHPVDSCCYLRYVKNDPAWPAELPAINEKLEDGRGFNKAPEGSAPVNIPPQGAIFER